MVATGAQTEGWAAWGSAGFCRRGPGVRGHRLEETQDCGPGRLSTCVTSTLGGPEMTPGWTRGVSGSPGRRVSGEAGRALQAGGKHRRTETEVLMNKETVGLEVAP